ncbi:MAG: hypothetical protein C0483_11455 [Pirellula sp.]|nr:hypothetical protein [Pirellula sp.]
MEYVSLAEKNRFRFLQSVLERRFEYLGAPVDLGQILGRSELGPTLALAREIRQCFEANKDFYYHGLDTISDLCSGDFAMGLQLVRRIFLRAGINWRSPTPIAPHEQHRAISDYTTEEYEYLQYHTVEGRTVHLIADRLAWLSRECVLTKESVRDGRPHPVVKNHLDVSEKAIRDLSSQSTDLKNTLNDLVRRGVLFPLESSRAREGHEGTRRYMLRRILLARYPKALGRHTPIKFDDVERLKHFLTDPETFVQAELDRTGQTRRPQSDQQGRLDLNDEAADA